MEIPLSQFILFIGDCGGQGHLQGGTAARESGRGGYASACAGNESKEEIAYKIRRLEARRLCM